MAWHQIVKTAAAVSSFKFLAIDEMSVVPGESSTSEYMVVCFSSLYETVDELQLAGAVTKQHRRKAVGPVARRMSESYGHTNMDFSARLSL